MQALTMRELEIFMREVERIVLAENGTEPE